MGYDGVVCVHVDDQMDGKSLIGSYVCVASCGCLLRCVFVTFGACRCTDTPGEFKWQPGALAVAVMKGKLVLLEDIDRAPPDVGV